MTPLANRHMSFKEAHGVHYNVILTSKTTPTVTTTPNNINKSHLMHCITQSYILQVSPPSEHRIVTDPWYPWWERYQPVSYSMNSRSGTEAEFRQMVSTCNDLGV